jgi:GNAT superfamily N-acetyltransferase
LTDTSFVLTDPDVAPASELLAEMTLELNELYGDAGRLARPRLELSDLRGPSGAYLVAWQGDIAVAGGGVRALGATLGEIKRMYVRPAARSQGVAGALLAALERTAQSLGYESVRLDTGPKQPHAKSLYLSRGYVEIAPYNDNKFAAFWGEKPLTSSE